jgi:hypothetical protein
MPLTSGISDFGFSTHPPDENPQITQMDADITAHSPPGFEPCATR